MTSFDELKRTYAFNPGILKDRFLNVADTVFYSNCLYQKQYNFLMFRMRNPNLPLPKLLFSYSLDSSKLIDQDNSVREFINTYYKLDDKANQFKFSISKVLQEGFKFDIPASKLQLSHNIQLFTPTDRILDNQKNGNEIIKSPELRIPFIVDYFCTSTFPAIFAHFSTYEYQLAGFNFIKCHIKDKLAPRLIGTYLFHNTLFKDRFLSNFFKMVIDPVLKNSLPEDVIDHKNYNADFPDDQEEEIAQLFKDPKYLSREGLLKILYDAFSISINYLSEFNFKIINLLRENDEQSAIISICNYFLYEIVSVWKYSPIFNLTSIFNKTKSIKNPETFNEIFRVNILDNLSEAIISCNSFAIKILDLFRDQASLSTEIPSISSMKYDSGFSFCVSIADMRLIYCITIAEKRENAMNSNTNKSGKKIEMPQNTNVRDFISEMFLLRFGYKQYLSSSINEPKSEILATELCEEKLRENEQFLNFLIDRMKGMKYLQMCTNSSLELLKLKERQYALHLWKNENICSNDFRQSALSSFCFSIFTGYVNYNINYIQKLIEIGDEHFYNFFKSSFINPYFKKDLVSFLFDQITNIYQVFRANLENAGNVEIHFSPDMIESTKYLVSEIERISLELLLTEMNETPYQFLKSELPSSSQTNLDEFRNKNLKDYLDSNTDYIKSEDLPEAASDFASFMFDELVLMKSIIKLTDDEMKKEINGLTEQFRIGDKLMLFLLIKDFVKKSLDKIGIDDVNDPNFLKYILPSVIRDDFYDFDYFRANLINCIIVFKSIFNSNSFSFPTLAKEIVDDLDFLANVFDVKMH